MNPFRSALMTGAVLLAAGCSSPDPSTRAADSAPQAGAGFNGGDCNMVTDAEVVTVTSAAAVDFTQVMVSDVGCFWQENGLLGDVGAGMGISTWWYRGSELDTERKLERSAGRTLTELTMAGNRGFEAFDTNVCSIYVTKDDDVIAWSIQTLNPEALPDLCTIVDALARRSQDRVN